MKTLLTIILLFFSAGVFADAGAIAMYDPATLSVKVVKGEGNNPDAYKEVVYLVGKDGRVENTGKTVAEFIKSVTE